jgi:hypothetical protein
MQYVHNFDFIDIVLKHRALLITEMAHIGKDQISNCDEAIQKRENCLLVSQLAFN